MSQRLLLLPRRFSIAISKLFHLNIVMAKSKFEYVREFEHETRCLPNSWIVVRIDGKGFHQFTADHDFAKPNDAPALELMTRAARDVFDLFQPDIVLAYGQSDEYSFIFRRHADVHGRRMNKLMSQVVSQFSSSFVFHWASVMGERRLRYPPVFDGRTVLYPSDQNIRDYISWRQADCHINNLYNTAFWALVNRGGLTNAQAEERLRGTVAADKNELLFSEFEINYNNEPALFRKGTTIVRTFDRKERSGQQSSTCSETQSTEVKIASEIESRACNANSEREQLQQDGSIYAEVDGATQQPQGHCKPVSSCAKDKTTGNQTVEACGDESDETDERISAAVESGEVNIKEESEVTPFKVNNGKVDKKWKRKRKDDRALRMVVKVLHCDVIGNEFWRDHQLGLSGHRKIKPEWSLTSL